MSPITQYIPSALWSRILGAWPDHQLKVVKGFASSPSSIYASLTMAGHEMTTIRDLDVDLLTSNKDRIWMYFAEEDEWVGEHKDTISKVFDDRQSVRVVHGHRDIPHAFCISEYSDYLDFMRSVLIHSSAQITANKLLPSVYNGWRQYDIFV